MDDYSPTVRSYKMTVASGFAPNVYGGTLTLATCKPGIMTCAQIGEWIAGFTSKAMNGDEVGHERLIYLMQVEQIMSIPEYWEAFPQKRPNINLFGDNIYCLPDQAQADGFSSLPIHVGSNPFGFVRVEPIYHHHEPSRMAVDIAPNRILVSNRYRYFGQDNPLELDYAIRQFIRIPRGQHPYGYITAGEQAKAFISYVMNFETMEIENDIYVPAEKNHTTLRKPRIC